MKKEVKALKRAELCLKEANKKKNKKHKDAYMFQFCKQMQLYCEGEADKSTYADQLKSFKEYARTFDAFSKIYKRKEGRK